MLPSNLPVVDDWTWPGLTVPGQARQQSFGLIVGLLNGSCRRTPRMGSPGHNLSMATGGFLASHLGGKHVGTTRTKAAPCAPTDASAGARQTR